MRCNKCGTEIDDGTLCPNCAGGSSAIAGCARRGCTILGCGCVLIIAFAVWVNMNSDFKVPHRREAGQRHRSLDNIRQLAIAASSYRLDYGDALPGWVRNPNGEYVHNVWDDQLDPYLKSKAVYANGDRGIRSYSDPGKSRVLTYGMNGLLIAPETKNSDGNADFTTVDPARPPKPLEMGKLAKPSSTIAFAEIATRNAMPGIYGAAPKPLLVGREIAGTGSRQWQKALTGWIDISPRAFVEIVHPVGNNYTRPYSGYAGNGIARDLWGGTGCYAFADGHVQFLRIGDTVGIGTAVNGRTVTPANCWAKWNTTNMWIPR